jgi:YidC/Oxa1 family membrane protein insertase
MLRVYKEHQVHPLSGIVTIFLQLPIVIGLYWVFFKGGLPDIDLELLYSYVSAPHTIQMNFLGIFLGGKSIVLALLVGATQFAVGRAMFDTKTPTPQAGKSFKEDFMKSMQMQMKYMLPIMLGIFAYILSSAVALHWVTGNLFTLIQDTLIKRQFRDKE